MCKSYATCGGSVIIMLETCIKTTLFGSAEVVL